MIRRAGSVESRRFLADAPKILDSIYRDVKPQCKMEGGRWKLWHKSLAKLVPCDDIHMSKLRSVNPPT